jgi:hypothetical protein
MKALLYLCIGVAVAIAPDRANVSKAFLQLHGTVLEDDVMQESAALEVWQPNGLHMPTAWSDTSKFALPVQYLFAFLWILMLASLPSIVPLSNRKMPTRSQLIVGALMLVVFFGGLLLFTNIILFQSVHFKKIRPLTIVECMYFMSQVITTVGYGDITPAKVRGQVFVGLYVLGAMFIISMVVSDVINQLIESAEKYKKHLRSRALSGDQGEQGEEESHEGKLNTRKGQRSKGNSEISAQSIDRMLNLAPAQRPSLQGLLISLMVFGVIDLAWVLFFSLHPEEGKNTFQALYMSVITLTSVGLGWFTPVTEEGMIFAAYVMIFGCAALVNVITQFTDLMLKLNEYEKHSVDDHREEAAQVLETVCERDHVNSAKVSEIQFMEFCLLQMKCIEPEHLDRIQEAFHQMKPQNGVADLKVIKKELLGLGD